MVNHFNFDPAPSVAERAKKKPPFARMTQAKASIEHTIGSVISNLGKLDLSLKSDKKHSAAVDVLAAERALKLVKADIADLERWINQYTSALSELTTMPE